MPSRQAEPAARQRIDKWLWAARFFKTRTLASQAVEAGHVQLNGHVIKPARELRAGDTLEITAHGSVWTIVVMALNAYRRPATEARQLYQETEQSAARRAAEQEARRLAPVPGSELRGRPTKKARRQIHQFGRDF